MIEHIPYRWLRRVAIIVSVPFIVLVMVGAAFIVLFQYLLYALHDYLLELRDFHDEIWGLFVERWNQ